MKTLLLIDSHAIIHRAYHALPPLTSSDGKPTNALYGVSSLLLKVLGGVKPDYVAALFDRPEPTFRKEKYEEYKAQRAKADDDLVAQIIEARELFENFGIAVFEAPGFEADDLIATLAKRFSEEKNLQIIILTGDLDTLQLVDGKKVIVRVLKKGVSETFDYDEEAVRERYGLKPEQLVDYKALVGDPSDNIKGVPGIGPKTATDLLQKYGSLEGLYKKLDKSERKYELLKSSEGEARAAQELVQLRFDAPAKVKKIEELVWEDGDKHKEQLKAYFEKLGFQSLVRRLGGVSGKEDEREEKNTFKKPKSKLEGVVVLEEFSKEWENGELKIGFNLKEKIKRARREGKDLAPPYFDIGIGFWLLNSDAGHYEAEELSRKFFKRSYKGTPEEVADFYDYLKKELKKQELENIFYEIEMPVLRILAEMEELGITVEAKDLEALDKKITKKLAELTEKIYKKAGQSFNINSPSQLSSVLFDVLKLKGPARRTPGGQRSTRAGVLEDMVEAHPIVGLVLEYREDFKILTTYIQALPKLIDKDGRLRTTYIQTGAATGRLASRDPNLQNIPRESQWSKDIRRAFRANKGFSLVAFDYSQIELRLMAALSEDPGLTEAFKKGLDIHAATAAKIFDVSLKEVQPEMRRVAKTLNFGLMYGMGSTSFAKATGVSREKANEFIATYFEEFPKVRAWHEEAKHFGRKYGYVKTLLGRRRQVPAITAQEGFFRAAAEREAINHPIQGLDADINKLAMVKVRELLVDKGVWMREVRVLLSIHDELLFEMADDKIQTLAPLIRKEMEGAYPLSVPLVVDVSFGKNWGELSPLTP
ncbi:MAG: hypothetical protein KGZ30_04720 [Anaplasmataceae bacterium]|nr:hypothetical protein [Anaplasmataceae bacterium]